MFLLSIDCEGDEIDPYEQNEEIVAIEAGNDSVEDDNENVTNDETASTANDSNKKAKLSNLSDDPDIEMDAGFLDKLSDLMAEQKTSKLFIPIISQLRVVESKGRRSVKRRIETKKKSTIIQDGDVVEDDNEPLDTMETLFDDNDDTYGVSELKPGIGEHWKVKHGQNFLYALIVTESPLSVQYFEPSAKGKNHILSDTVFEVLLEDLDGKVESPSMVKKGRRTFYSFK